MPEYDPQERRQAGEDALRSQLNPAMSPGGVYLPPGMAEKQLADQAAQQDLINKNTTDSSSYLAAHQANQRQVEKVQQSLNKQGKEYADTLSKVQDLSAKELENQLKMNNLLYKKKELLGDIRALEDKSANARQQLRVQQAREDLAQVEALKRQGFDPNALPGGINPGTKVGDLIAHSQVGTGRALLNRFERTRIGGAVARNAAEIGGIENLASPAGLMQLVRANPVVSAAFAGIQAVQLAQNFEQTGIGGVPLIGRFLAQIPGVTPLTAYGATRREGQVTGEGYGAGLAAAGEAFRLGSNPFDAVSNETAKAIVSAVRGQGFRGAMAREFENSIKGIYKDTGLDVGLIAGIAEPFVRRGRLAELRASMEDLDKVAHDTGLSVQAVAEQFQSLNETLLAGGGVQQAGLAHGILGAVNRAFPQLTGAQRGAIGQFTVQGFSAFSGLPETFAQTPYGSQVGMRNMRQMIGQFSTQFRALGPATGDPNRQQQMLIAGLRSMPQFAGLDYPSLLHVLRNPDYLSRIPRSVGRYEINRAFSGASVAGQREEDRVHDFTRRASMGLVSHDEVMNTHFAPVHQTYISALERNLQATKLSQTQVSGILDPLRAAAAGHGDWGDAMKRAGEKARSYSDVQSRQKGTLNIRLDGPETRKLLGGKNVSKLVQLEGSFEGKLKGVGTAFTDPFG
jgi:hypothetical protein